MGTTSQTATGVKMKKEYEYGNIILKTHPESEKILKVYKCPYLGCEKFFTNESDKEYHMQQPPHNELADKLIPRLNNGAEDVKEGIKQIVISINKQRLKHLAHNIAISMQKSDSELQLEKSFKKQPESKSKKPTNIWELILKAIKGKKYGRDKGTQ